MVDAFEGVVAVLLVIAVGAVRFSIAEGCQRVAAADVAREEAPGAAGGGRTAREVVFTDALVRAVWAIHVFIANILELKNTNSKF